MLNCFKENKVMKYNMTIHTMDNIHIYKKNYTSKWERKRNDYSITYNGQQYGNENSEY